MMMTRTKMQLLQKGKKVYCRHWLWVKCLILLKSNKAKL